MNEQIVMTVSPAGSVHIEANNFTGDACSIATQQLEVVIGGHGAKKKDMKPEYSMPASNSQHNKTTF